MISLPLRPVIKSCPFREQLRSFRGLQTGKLNSIMNSFLRHRFARLAVMAVTFLTAVGYYRISQGADAGPKGPVPKVGDTAPDYELNQLNGPAVKLSTLTAKGPVVMVQLRGFPGYQCPICTFQVGELIKKATQFSDAKANVLLLYPGPADGLKDHADEFVRGKDMPSNFYLLLDPDYKVVSLYGLRWDAPRETAYPATFVLNQKREVLYAKVSKTHGGRAPVQEVLDALPK